MRTWILLAAMACSTPEPEKKAETAPPAPEPAKVDVAKYGALAPLPANWDKPGDALDAKIALGRMLYYDERLSVNKDMSCNSCHQLDTPGKAGADGLPTAKGHEGKPGGRNSPTVLNAAGHLAQFWDGRAVDVEAQAKGPILNPAEMAMPDEKTVIERLTAIEGYKKAFADAFPGQENPITYDNLATAIGAFERRLVTPGKLDKFLGGDGAALSADEVAGLDLFMSTGCISCHSGALVGGGMYQKLGAVKPYETADVGRKAVTNNDADLHVFKVPSLRNIADTAPYFHDGSVATLEDAVKKMGEHQLGKTLDDAQVASIVTFLKALSAPVDATYVAKPTLP